MGDLLYHKLCKIKLCGMKIMTVMEWTRKQESLTEVFYVHVWNDCAFDHFNIKRRYIKKIIIIAGER